MPDELAEINGVKPVRLLADGEEVEARSESSKSVYQIKRTGDHYYCSCPAWRNQKGVVVQARTCKHLKSTLGDEYEKERTKSADNSSNSSKGKAAPKQKPAHKDVKANQRKADKSTGKRKTRGAARDDETAEQDEDDEHEEEDAHPAKRTRTTRNGGSSNAARKPSSRSRAGKLGHSEKEPETPGENMDVDASAPEDAAENGEDEMACIGGIKPLVYLKDGEETEARSEGRSKSGGTVYKIKRTWDHYYCSCPAWRNQKGVRTEARTCKHLKSVLGEAYEDARLARKIADLNDDQAKATTTDRTESKAVDGGQGHVGDQAEGDSNELAGNEDQVDSDLAGDDAGSAHGEDELACINGVEPKVYIKDGEEREVKSMTSSTTYKIKRTWDHYYCTCPAWRNQGGMPVNARSCKHLSSLLGEEYENARMQLKNPDGVKPRSKAKPASRKGKAKKSKDDDDDDGDDVSSTTKKAIPSLLLAHKWDFEKGADPTGWWMSEKLDGVRTYYDGKKNTMISRLGNPFTPPKWFLDKLPKDVTLDGELFGGRGGFQDTVSIVKTVNSPHWKGITFKIFDVPSKGTEPFEERYQWLDRMFGEGGEIVQPQIEVVAHEPVRDRDHVMEKLKEVESLGGEGLMLRKPQSTYEGHRSTTLLKIKTFYDAEARVTGYIPGKGKYVGMTGALQCVMASGKKFNVGTGMSDQVRGKPPKVGVIVCYRFQELTRDGVPRFPSFVGEAIDKDKPKDAEVPEHRKISVSNT